MSPTLLRWRTLGVGVCCAAAGVGTGAVVNAAASSGSSSRHHARPARAHARAHGRRELLRLARRTVQGDAVVHTKAGFQTVSWNRGTVESVSGDQLTLAEGTPKATYKTVTLTVPAGARVRDNGTRSSLSSLSDGQHALVVHLPGRTVVIARTPKAGASS